ncbi:MAG: TPM domain-containing protein [Candidatus Buchananbacteria bacterium]
MSRLIGVLLTLGGLLLFSQSALAYYSLGPPTGFVTDKIGWLSVSEKNKLEQDLTNYEKQTSNEIVVVTVDNLQGDTIENFAVKLFAEWQIGKKDKDNGILLLIAKQERQMRIEVGYGLEGDLTDAQSFQIIDKIVKPLFQQEKYGEGVIAGVNSIKQALSGNLEVPATTTNSNTQTKFDFGEFFFLLVFVLPGWLLSILARSKSWWLGGVIGAVIGVVIWFFSTWLVGLGTILLLGGLGLWLDYAVSKNYHERKAKGLNPAWWAGGGGFGGHGGGGGFGGFGGGSSGGGGASGGW